MPNATTGWSPKQLARAAGVFYLVIIVCGIWTEMFVRGPITVAGDPGATAANLLANEALFRIGFVAEAVMAVADVAVTVLLYLILRVVSKPLALAAAAFHLTQTAVLAANTMTAFGALLFLTANLGSATVPAAFDASQVNALTQHAFNVHGHGYSLALTFFGVNCLLLGLLIWRAAFLPKFLGLLMAASGLVYLTTSIVHFAAPEHYGTLSPAFLVCLIAELALALWLLIRGVNEAKWG